MAIHVYTCKYGHSTEVLEPATRESKNLRCKSRWKGLGIKCDERLVLSAAVPTGTPVLKAGKGGFYKSSTE